MDLQNPTFTDDDKARQALEAVRWPNGLSALTADRLVTISPR